jgi:hypothetical protein
MRCLTLLFVTLLLSGCSAEWHLSRAVKKDPTIIKERTLTVTDTVVTEPIVVRDTVITSQTDTVELIKDRFRVKVIRSYDTLLIDGGCESDTIVRTVTVTVPQLVAGETRLQRVQRFTFWGLITLLLVSIAVIITKRALPKDLL